MGLIKQLFTNCACPQGRMGRAMLKFMNLCHAPLTNWGLKLVNIQDGWTMLDIGCGGGATLQRLLKRSKDAQVYGIDISEESVAKAKKVNEEVLDKQVFVTQGSAEKLPYEDGKFDLVTAVETVYFWPNLLFARRTEDHARRCRLHPDRDSSYEAVECYNYWNKGLSSISFKQKSQSFWTCFGIFFINLHPMDIQSFFTSLLNVVCEMAPYLLLGFFITGVLHVFVPQKFYANYLSRNNKFSVLWAALLGIPLPLSILATFSLMGLGFAIIRPTAALITGVCGGLLVNRLVHEDKIVDIDNCSCQVEKGNRIWRVLKYAYYDMLRDIGLRLLIGLIVAALIQVAVPDEFFLSFGSQPLLQMLVILVIAVPMYICSTGSIPVAAALMMKGLSPGAALVMLMAGPAVNLASILVVHKSMGRRFTSIYLMTIVGFAVLFGLLLNATGIEFSFADQDACCMGASTMPSPFKIVCATVLTLLIIFALMMKFFSKFTTKKPLDPDVTVYRVEDMHCSHCEAAVVRAVEDLPGVEKAKASASANTLTIKGSATEEAIRAAVEGIGYTFKGKA